MGKEHLFKGISENRKQGGDKERLPGEHGTERWKVERREELRKSR